MKSASGIPVRLHAHPGVTSSCVVIMSLPLARRREGDVVWAAREPGRADCFKTA